MEPQESLQASSGSSSDGGRATASRTEILAAQLADAPCPSCGGDVDVQGAMAPTYIYALGHIEARFTSASVEKEFAQAIGRADTAGKTDHEAFYAVLALRENRYIARNMCWVLVVQGMDTYILQPRDPADFDLLIESIKERSGTVPWMSLVIGVRGPVASLETCNGLMVPIVAFDQIYSFAQRALIEAIPRPERMTEAKFRPVAEELFSRVMLMTDNAGATDEHRASNYAAMRSPALYAKAAEQFARDFSLTAVDVRPSPVSGTGRVMDVIFTYTNRNSDFVEKFFMRVDVSGEFPYLVTKMAPYFDR